MSPTVSSPCAPHDLRPEGRYVAPGSTARLRHATARYTGDRPHALRPEEFAALYHADKDRALALLAAMSEPQRVRQSLAYAAWLVYHGLEIDLDTVLEAWEDDG